MNLKDTKGPIQRITESTQLSIRRQKTRQHRRRKMKWVEATMKSSPLSLPLVVVQLAALKAAAE